MALRVRTPQLVDVLLDHVEANKGSNGLYICDYEAALIQATQVLAPFAMHLRPPVLMNASRIKHKLYDMVRNTNGRRERNGMRIERKDLFEQGRISLSPSYQKDVLVGVRPRNGSENYHPMPSQLAVPVPHQGSMTALPPSSKTSRRKKADSDMDFEPSQSPCFNDEGDEERGSKTIAAQGSETGTTPLTIEPVYDQETTEVIDLLEEDLSTELGDSSSPKPDVGITNSEDDDAEGAENDPEEEHNDAEEDDSEDCPAAIKEYMLDDPEHAVPKTKKLQTDCVRLIEEIHEAVEELLFMVTLPGRQNNPRNMKTPGDDELPPDIARALSRNPFYNLCLRTYGASNHHTLDASLRGSLISTKEFTRALLGAAIDEWVFNDGHHHLPDLKNRDITAISQALETDLARIHPHFADDLKRKSLCRYVQGADFSRFASALTSLFINDTKGFLMLNGVVLTGEDLNTWSASLDKIFLLALNIRSHIQLDGKIFTIWPATNDDFDGLTMTCIHKHQSTEGARIQLALFPQLNERVHDEGEDSGHRDRVLVKARVVLR